MKLLLISKKTPSYGLSCLSKKLSPAIDLGRSKRCMKRCLIYLSQTRRKINFGNNSQEKCWAPSTLLITKKREIIKRNGVPHTLLNFKIIKVFIKVCKPGGFWRGTHFVRTVRDAFFLWVLLNQWIIASGVPSEKCSGAG